MLDVLTAFFRRQGVNLDPNPDSLGHSKTCCAFPGYTVADCPSAFLVQWKGDTLSPGGVYYWQGARCHSGATDHISGPYNCTDGYTDEWEFPPGANGAAATSPQEIGWIFYSGIDPNVVFPPSGYVFNWKEIDLGEFPAPDDNYDWYTWPSNWVNACLEASKRGGTVPGYNGNYHNIDVNWVQGGELCDQRGCDHGNYQVKYSVDCSVWGGIPGDPCGNNVCYWSENPDTCPADCVDPEHGVYCGDNACNGDETPSTCPSDCGASPPVGALGAGFVSQQVGAYPYNMAIGERRTISVTMRNDGSETWFPEDNIRLGSQSPQDNLTWGVGRVNVPTAVPPGQIATFTFEVTAPSVANTYAMQWRMLKEGVKWFGAETTVVYFAVTQARDAQYQNWALCPKTGPGGTCRLDLWMKNMGSATWSAAGGYKLGLYSGNGYGVSRSPVSADVAYSGVASFTFDLTAPATAGVYDIGTYLMVQEDVASPTWFGAAAGSPNGLQLTVGNPDRLCYRNQAVCTAACQAENASGGCEWKWGCNSGAGGYKCFAY